MKKLSLFLALVAAATAVHCAKKEQAPKILTPPRVSMVEAVKYREKGNLAALAHGAVVIERTAEDALDVSPVFMIDSVAETAWLTPPNDPLQSATISLAAPSRITQIGMTTRGPSGAGRSVREVQVDLSSDGVSYRKVGVLQSPMTESVKLSLTPPVDASFVRVSLLAAPESHAVELASIEVNGVALTTPAPVAMTGTWSMPGGSVVLAVGGERLSGRSEMVESDTMFFEGRVREGVGFFSWTRGPEVGFGALAVKGDTLNAVLWHEKPIPLFVATSWIATRSGAGTLESRDEGSAVRQFLRVVGRYPSYLVTFDRAQQPKEIEEGHLETLLSVVRANPQHPFTLAVMSPFDLDENVNERASEERAAALRGLLEKRGALPKNLTIVARGSHYDQDFPSNELDRPLYDRIDLELGSFDTKKSIQTVELK